MNLGYKILATKNTAIYFNNHGINAISVNKLGDEDDIISKIINGEITLVINTPRDAKNSLSDGFKIRRAASESKVASFTNLDIAKAYLKALEEISLSVYSL